MDNALFQQLHRHHVNTQELWRNYDERLAVMLIEYAQAMFLEWLRGYE